jgi:hypothetical protein
MIYSHYISPEDGGNMFLRNVCIYLQVHTELQHRSPTLTLQSSFCVLMLLVLLYLRRWLCRMSARAGGGEVCGRAVHALRNTQHTGSQFHIRCSHSARREGGSTSVGSSSRFPRRDLDTEVSWGSNCPVYLATCSCQQLCYPNIRFLWGCLLRSIK